MVQDINSSVQTSNRKQRIHRINQHHQQSFRVGRRAHTRLSLVRKSSSSERHPVAGALLVTFI